jgi:hypothetical protein
MTHEIKISHEKLIKHENVKYPLSPSLTPAQKAEHDNGCSFSDVSSSSENIECKLLPRNNCVARRYFQFPAKLFDRILFVPPTLTFGIDIARNISWCSGGENVWELLVKLKGDFSVQVETISRDTWGLKRSTWKALPLSPCTVCSSLSSIEMEE